LAFGSTEVQSHLSRFFTVLPPFLPSFPARPTDRPTIVRRCSNAGFTNERGLGLKELLHRVGHYAPSTRKDALTGLKSLFVSHPTLLGLSTTLMRLFEKVAPRITDTDPTVRAGLLGLVR